jgi:acyl-CoA dehydrogenase
VLMETAVSHLTSRDPDAAWTAADWVTEHRPASDAPLPTATRDDGGAWRLHGRKPSARGATANVALALAQPEGATHPALFYVPLREGDDLQGPLRDGLRVRRLRDTLGARKRPTADLELDGALAHPLSEEPGTGAPSTSPMHNVTQTWSAVTGTALLRRSLALARDHGQKREAYGDDLINHPLHQETLADAQATLEGAFHLSFRLAELMGARETGQADASTDALVQILTPLAKLTTARQAVSTTSEMLEAFGRAGYDEDTGLPALHRDAQMLPLRGGTTNELSLALLRRLRDVGSFAPLKQEVEQCVDAIDAPTLRTAIRPAVKGVRDAALWLKQALDEGEDALHGGARRFALTLGRSLEVLYTAHHAQWSLQEEQDGRSAAATERLAAREINRIADLDRHGAYVLVWDFNCPTLFDCHAAGDGAAEEEPVLDGFADVL